MKTSVMTRGKSLLLAFISCNKIILRLVPPLGRAYRIYMLEPHFSRLNTASVNTLTGTRRTAFGQLSRIFNFDLAGLLHRP